MSVGFGDDFREQVRAATNIVDLVSESVALTPNGRDYKGLCPFHDDKNPSFNVYPDRQSYRCWVCDVGGDCFTWVMEIEKVAFPEALERLAERAHIELPKKQKSEFFQRNKERKVTQYEVVDWAIRLMQQSLQASPEDSVVRRYVKQRNLSPETVKNFRLGYHPEDWSWFLEKAKGKYTEQQLLSVGLVGERDGGRGYYDNLVGRLIFPIIDEQKRAVAFGGRVLPESNIDSPAKYWNSPESTIFLKRRTLYAFDQARDAIRKSETAVVVEGYMDCIACHQAGVTNVVATLGTALTEDHVKFLKRFCKRVTLVYDGDQAGRDAAERSIERFLAQDLDLRILTLSEGEDPADYLETNSKNQFEAILQEAPEAWAYKLQTVIERFDTDSVAGRQQVINQMVGFLAAAPGLSGTMREDLIVRNVCQRVQVDELTFRRQLQDSRKTNSSRQRFVRHDQPSEAPQAIKKRLRGADLAERELLEIILTVPETTDYIRHQIGPDDFVDAQYRRLLELCFDLVAEEGLLPEPQRVIAAAESDSAMLSLVNALLDSAGEKGISKFMSEPPPGHEGIDGNFVPPMLEMIIQSLRNRRDEQQMMLSKQKLAQTQPASSSELLSDKDIEALQQIQNLRKREMGNPSSPR